MITLSNLTKTYSSSGTVIEALSGVDLTVGRGQIHGIVGPSGAGKSTLVRMLTLLERPTSGSVTIDGEVLTDLPVHRLRTARRRIGMVFQHVNLLDSRTAARNIAHPLEIARVSKVDRAARVAELLDLVGLADRADAYPGQLSGGQRQRIGIARALAAEPDVLLCDEPTSALDPTTTHQILSLVQEIRDRLGVTVLLITHEMSAVRQICDGVSLLDHGRIVQSGRLAEMALDPAGPLARHLVPVPNGTVERPETVNLEVSALARDSAASSLDIFRTLIALEDSIGIAGAGAQSAGDHRDGVSDIRVEAGTLETLNGAQVGRFRIAVRKDLVETVTVQLRDAGLHAEVAQ